MAKIAPPAQSSLRDLGALQAWDAADPAWFTGAENSRKGGERQPSCTLRGLREDPWERANELEPPVIARHSAPF